MFAREKEREPLPRPCRFPPVASLSPFLRGLAPSFFTPKLKRPSLPSDPASEFPVFRSLIGFFLHIRLWIFSLLTS